MAAAANKPGALHYSLVFFVILAVAAGIFAYSFYRDATQKAADVAKLQQEKSNLQSVQKTLDAEVQAAKAFIGIKMDAFYDPNNPQNQATVLAGLRSEILAQGKDAVVQTTTAVEALRKLREILSAAEADRDSKAVKIAALEKEVLALRNEYQAQVDNYKGAATNSERDKLGVISDRDERINAKIQEVAKLKSELNNTVNELEQERESRENERKDLNSKIAVLEQRIDILKDKIDNLERLSFEVADGLIRRVEHANHTVWINLGEKDFLKPRMTFSVYARDNQAVGRGAEDIKGKIEVTRILNDHMAEARIIDEDLYRPIVAEDLIYTPIWSPGLKESVSLIGLIDIDHDGRSDRQQLHELLAHAGCVIDNEVDENGERTPPEGKITVNTRFLVLGEIPELLDAPNDIERAKITKINAALTELRKEARANGVRVIKLNDFLAYIGYHNKRRSFLPGQERPFQLKAGSSSSVSTGEKIDRTSSGNVSGIFTNRRQAPQETSDGNASKAFGGGSK